MHNPWNAEDIWMDHEDLPNLWKHQHMKGYEEEEEDLICEEGRKICVDEMRGILSKSRKGR